MEKIKNNIYYLKFNSEIKQQLSEKYLIRIDIFVG